MTNTYLRKEEPRRAPLTVALLIMLWLAASQQLAAEEFQRCAPNRVAVGGYDLVSYHQPGRLIPGSPDFVHHHNGLRYYFHSAENLAVFQDGNENYLPVYQGWCVATLAMGRLACPDYTNYKVEDGRLLLFELAGFTNGRSLWNSDSTGFRQRADANFKTLVN
ncbi:MAG: YHS domain-containing (seleno)protein [Pseudomonadota bacterium]